MHIVQSFWSRPFRSEGILTEAQFGCGWRHRIFNYYSWALSCLQLRRFYEDVEIVTDALGKEILIDRLKLPYSKVTVALDALDAYSPGLWSLGKVYAYGLQQEPFLHVDADVYIWKEFDEDIVGAALVTQNLETAGPRYSTTFMQLCETFSVVPEYFKPFYDMGYSPSCNAGIFGGNDVAFIQRYVGQVFGFLKDNEQDIDRLVKVNAGNFSVIIEQVLFYSYALSCGQEISYLLPPADGIPPVIGYFNMAELNRLFVHCVGYYKRDRLSYAYLEWKLQQHYPEYYYRINRLIADSEI